MDRGIPRVRLTRGVETRSAPPARRCCGRRPRPSRTARFRMVGPSMAPPSCSRQPRTATRAAHRRRRGRQRRGRHRGHPARWSALGPAEGSAPWQRHRHQPATARGVASAAGGRSAAASATRMVILLRPRSNAFATSAPESGVPMSRARSPSTSTDDHVLRPRCWQGRHSRSTAPRSTLPAPCPLPVAATPATLDPMAVPTRTEALALLLSTSPSPRLLQHVTVVAEVASIPRLSSDAGRHHGRSTPGRHSRAPPRRRQDPAGGTSTA